MTRRPTPLITVCMPIYNSARYVVEAIESVLVQSFTDFELLIIDDGSTDGTAEIAARYAGRDARVKFQVNPGNLGMVRNWNLCLERASGSYIKFLFGDDVLAPDTLARMAEILDRNPAVSLVASGRILIDECSRPITNWVHFDSGAFEGASVVRRCVVEQENLVGEPSAVMFRKSQAQRGFDESYRQLVDLEMWYHLLEKGRLAYIAEPLCSFRRHSAQQTQKNESQLVNFSEMFALSASYLRKPYVGFGCWDAHWFMFRHYYGLWKMFRRHERLSPIMHGIIGRQYGRKNFYGTMVLYKLYSPCRKLARIVRQGRRSAA